MPDLFGNHIVGFPTRWLILCNVPVGMTEDASEIGCLGGGVGCKKNIVKFESMSQLGSN